MFHLPFLASCEFERRTVRRNFFASRGLVGIEAWHFASAAALGLRLILLTSNPPRAFVSLSEDFPYQRTSRIRLIERPRCLLFLLLLATTDMWVTMVLRHPRRICYIWESIWSILGSLRATSWLSAASVLDLVLASNSNK